MHTPGGMGLAWIFSRDSDLVWERANGFHISDWRLWVDGEEVATEYWDEAVDAQM